MPLQFRLETWIWYDHPTQSYIPVQMITDKGKSIICRSINNEQFDVPANQNYDDCNITSLRSIDNMVEMEELSEAAILHNLRIRFDENIIYTNISSILVSLNPFKMINIYGSVG